jgi:hypothetical protein
MRARSAATSRTLVAAAQPVRRAQRAREHNLRIRRIDDDATDSSGLFEAHPRPRLAGVRRFVDAFANRDVAADPRLAGARPDDTWIRRRHRQRADRLHRLIVEDLLPVDAAIDSLGDAA